MTATAAPLLDCGHPPTPYGAGSGIATDGRTGYTRCYPCAFVAERQWFAESDRYLGYDSGDGHVRTWTGGQLARVTSRAIGRGGFGSRVVYLRAVAPDGSRWHGRHSADCECVTLHRCKGNGR